MEDENGHGGEKNGNGYYDGKNGYDGENDSMGQQTGKAKRLHPLDVKKC